MTGRWKTSVAELFAARAGAPTTALIWLGPDGVERRVTWDEHVRHSAQRAAFLAARLPAAGAAEAEAGAGAEAGLRHVGVLMENVPEFSYLLGAAALGGFPLVGLNPTRGAAELVRDARHTDCALIVTESRFADMLDGCGVPVLNVDSAEQWAEPIRDEADDVRPVPAMTAASDLPFMLILTSGTTSAPKAVVCSQGKIAYQGTNLAGQRGLTKDDVLYCAMPLFHSNAVIAAWVPAVATGATLALRRRFSASGFLPDVRLFGATYANYVGKPLAYILATPAKPDDADSSLRQVFGNEAAPADAERFGKRFGCLVTDAFGSTEGGISFYRLPATPPAALGVPVGDVRIVDPDTGRECPDGEVGEMVNFAGAGAFEGYYKHQEADEAKLREGRFWSGDLAYRDADGNFFFAGRSGDWIRVGGENFASAPVSRAVEEWDGAVAAAAYGVPDVAAGDQVMVAVEVADPAAGFDPAAFAAYLAARTELPRLWWPRYVRVVESMPRTATNKVVVRGLVEEAWCTPDAVYVRTDSAAVSAPDSPAAEADSATNFGPPTATVSSAARHVQNQRERPAAFRLLTAADRADLAREFAQHGRIPPRDR
jgi:fatty-acyl-CoA synthase